MPPMAGLHDISPIVANLCVTKAVLAPTRAAAAAAELGAKKLKTHYPDRVTVRMLEDAGHAILPEQPEQVSLIVLEHLAGR
mgnify:CR=1 FL=1